MLYPKAISPSADIQNKCHATDVIIKEICFIIILFFNRTIFEYTFQILFFLILFESNITLGSEFHEPSIIKGVCPVKVLSVLGCRQYDNEKYKE